MGPTHLVVSHSQALLWQVPIAFFFGLHESSNPRPQGPYCSGEHSHYQLSYSVGSESAPHFNIGPCGRGLELSRRRKKRAIGTCPYSPVSEWSPPAGRPRGGALTIKGAFYCESPTHGSHPLSGLSLTIIVMASPYCLFLSPP